MLWIWRSRSIERNYSSLICWVSLQSPLNCRSSPDGQAEQEPSHGIRSLVNFRLNQFSVKEDSKIFGKGWVKRSENSIWHANSLRLKELGKRDRKFPSEVEVRGISKQKMEISSKFLLTWTEQVEPICTLLGKPLESWRCLEIAQIIADIFLLDKLLWSLAVSMKSSYTILILWIYNFYTNSVNIIIVLSENLNSILEWISVKFPPIHLRDYRL